jgi:hypothetical protein
LGKEQANDDPLTKEEVFELKKEILKLKAHPSVRGIVEGNVFPKDVQSLNKNRLIYYSENFQLQFENNYRY